MHALKNILEYMVYDLVTTVSDSSGVLVSESSHFGITLEISIGDAPLRHVAGSKMESSWAVRKENLSVPFSHVELIPWNLLRIPPEIRNKPILLGTCLYSGLIMKSCLN